MYLFSEPNQANADGSAISQIASRKWDAVRAFILFDPGVSTEGLNPRYIATGRGFIDRMTGVLFWLGLVVAIRRWRQTALWLVFFVVMVFPIQVLSADTPNGARAIGATPFFYLFAGVGINWLLGLRIARPTYLRATALAILALIAFYNVSGYFHWMDQPHAADARQPAVLVDEFERWQSLQKEAAEAGGHGFNVGEWRQMQDEGR